MVRNKEQFVLILLLFSKDLYHDVTASHVTPVSWRYCIVRDTCIMTLMYCTWHLYHDVTALHVTLVSWRYCIAHDSCILTLLHCTCHLYHDVTVSHWLLYLDATALHVTLVSWRYSIARDTCIMTLLHCTWHLYHDVTVLHVTRVLWRYCIVRDSCIMTLLYCTWHLCLRDSEALRLLNYFTFLYSMCTPSASWLRSIRINNYIYIYMRARARVCVCVCVILRYLYFIIGTSWAYSWMSFALPGHYTGHKIGPQFLIPTVPYRFTHSWSCILADWSRKTRHEMYVKPNNEACSRNHCCRVEAILHILSVCL
jgi:hypothetical protein